MKDNITIGPVKAKRCNNKSPSPIEVYAKIPYYRGERYKENITSMRKVLQALTKTAINRLNVNGDRKFDPCFDLKMRFVKSNAFYGWVFKKTLGINIDDFEFDMKAEGIHEIKVIHPDSIPEYKLSYGQCCWEIEWFKNQKSSRTYQINLVEKSKHSKPKKFKFAILADDKLNINWNETKQVATTYGEMRYSNLSNPTTNNLKFVPDLDKKLEYIESQESHIKKILKNKLLNSSFVAPNSKPSKTGIHTYDQFCPGTIEIHVSGRSLYNSKEFIEVKKSIADPNCKIALFFQFRLTNGFPKKSLMNCMLLEDKVFEINGFDNWTWSRFQVCHLGNEIECPYLKKLAGMKTLKVLEELYSK